jgi:hypothetical protein
LTLFRRTRHSSLTWNCSSWSPDLLFACWWENKHWRLTWSEPDYSKTCEERTPWGPSQIVLFTQVSSLQRNDGHLTKWSFLERCPLFSGASPCRFCCIFSAAQKYSWIFTSNQVIYS